MLQLHDCVFVCVCVCAVQSGNHTFRCSHLCFSCMTVCVCLCCAERESYIETLKRATYCWPQALDRCVCVFLSVCLCECMCVCVWVGVWVGLCALSSLLYRWSACKLFSVEYLHANKCKHTHVPDCSSYTCVWLTGALLCQSPILPATRSREGAKVCTKSTCVCATKCAHAGLPG